MQVYITTFLFTLLIACQPSVRPINDTGKVMAIDTTLVQSHLIVGAERPGIFVSKLKGKRVGIVVNQTSRIGREHTVDSLIKLGVDIRVIMAPEHGFRGDGDAGEHIANEKDQRTGIPIISLYGKRKKPLPEDLSNIDVVIFDIQDVGVRFYTYISTLHYVMEACAEQSKKLIILDRPNPNGHYIDGPVLELTFKSFIGMHPVPVVHGMTIGEYARMINGEKWLNNSIICDLTVIECKNYTHSYFYDLPIRPSPNLPNMRAIYLYPSTCFFEGTHLSLGRGTDKQFQVIGHPKLNDDFSFCPQPNLGAKDPLYKGQICRGTDLSELPIGGVRDHKKVDISYLVSYYQKCNDLEIPFFLENKFFDKLAGTDRLRKMIEAGNTVDEIRSTWQDDLEQFRVKRAKYLLYPLE